MVNIKALADHYWEFLKDVQNTVVQCISNINIRYNNILNKEDTTSKMELKKQISSLSSLMQLVSNYPNKSLLFPETNWAAEALKQENSIHQSADTFLSYWPSTKASYFFVFHAIQHEITKPEVCLKALFSDPQVIQRYFNSIEKYKLDAYDYVVYQSDCGSNTQERKMSPELKEKITNFLTRIMTNSQLNSTAVNSAKKVTTQYDPSVLFANTAKEDKIPLYSSMLFITGIAKVHPGVYMGFEEEKYRRQFGAHIGTLFQVEQWLTHNQLHIVFQQLGFSKEEYQNFLNLYDRFVNTLKTKIQENLLSILDLRENILVKNNIHNEFDISTLDQILNLKQGNVLMWSKYQVALWNYLTQNIGVDIKESYQKDINNTTNVVDTSRSVSDPSKSPKPGLSK